MKYYTRHKIHQPSGRLGERGVRRLTFHPKPKWLEPKWIRIRTYIYISAGPAGAHGCEARFISISVCYCTVQSSCYPLSSFYPAFSSSNKILLVSLSCLLFTKSHVGAKIARQNLVSLDQQDRFRLGRYYKNNISGGCF